MTSSHRFRLLLACFVFFVPVALLGQYHTYYTYSFGRPHAGGDFALRHFMIEDSAEYLMRTYAPHEIADFDPVLSPNKAGSDLEIVIYGMDTANVWSYYVLDWIDGHIISQWTPQTVVPRLVTFDRIDTLYIIGPPPGGGNERLVKLALGSGNEALMGTFLPGQLASALPSRMEVDDFWGPIRLSTVDTAGVSRILEIDHFTAQVDTVFTTNNYPILAMDLVSGGIHMNAFVLARSYGLSDYALHEINLTTGTDQIINAFPQATIYDFHPQTFYVSDIDFGLTTVDSLGDEQVKVFYLDNINGSAHRYWMDPGAYDAKVLLPNGSFFVSVADANAPVITGYPNPASEEVRIQGAEPGSSFMLMNATGHLIRRGMLDGQAISLAGLPAGMYLVQVGEGAGRQVVRLVKQ